MPYTETGPSLQRALRHLSADPFVQAAILRVYRAQPAALADSTTAALERAERLDGVGLQGYHGVVTPPEVAQERADEYWGEE